MQHNYQNKLLKSHLFPSESPVRAEWLGLLRLPSVVIGGTALEGEESVPGYTHFPGEEFYAH